MPLVQTRDFGLLAYDLESQLDFPAGLPGFEGEKRFILIENDALAPMVFLQSLTTPSLCFLTVPVQVVDPGYQIGMTDEDRARLGIESVGDPTNVLTLAILTTNESSAEHGGTTQRCTANLLAPVVVNMQLKRGVQAVRADKRYSHQHPIPDPISEVPACS